MKHLDIHENYLRYFHINLATFDLSRFSNIDHVIMQGSQDRTRELAIQYYRKIIGSYDSEPINLLPEDSYFVVYRVKNILFVSHGMGFTSILALLNNLTKLMFKAGNLDVKYIRIGTSGGINIPPGTVIITETAYIPSLILHPLKQDHVVPTALSYELNQKIIAAQPPKLKFEVLLGNSIAANDFYLGQARFDGVIKPSFNQKEREEYFARIKELNILNFEMESVALAHFCNLLEIKAAMVAVTILDRFKGDQISSSAEDLKDFSSRSAEVVINYLLKLDNYCLA